MQPPPASQTRRSQFGAGWVTADATGVVVSDPLVGELEVTEPSPVDSALDELEDEARVSGGGDVLGGAPCACVETGDVAAVVFEGASTIVADKVVGAADELVLSAVSGPVPFAAD